MPPLDSLEDVCAKAEAIAWVEIKAKAAKNLCPNGILPDGPVCPQCGGNRAPSGIDGGTWVHFNPEVKY